MSFDFVAICEVCNAMTPARDEGELPSGWFEVGEKTMHGTLSMVVLDRPECLLSYAKQRNQQHLPARAG